MSISGTLSNALSGLTAASRSADVSASNIANAMTEGYGVREIVLAPRAIGDDGGVQVVGVRRQVNLVLLSDRRGAEATLAESETLKNFFNRMQIDIGLPGESGSLNDRLVQLESSLTEATLAPESEPLLLRVVGDLADLASHLNNLGNSVQAERMRADSEISNSVDTLNANLQQIEDLTDSIKKHTVLGHDVSSMLDYRQNLVDGVNEIIPVTELDRGQGDIALMATGGTLLFDGRAVELEFNTSTQVTPQMTLENGTLSGLKINGNDVAMSRDPSPIDGGSLDALFHIRDVDAVQLQGQLDGYARDLIERLEDPSIDSTRTGSVPGLLTDNGEILDPLEEVGLSQRISVNELVDPDQGGSIWRIRDGLGTSSPIPGGEGNSGLINRISEALAAYETPTSSAYSDSMRTSSSLASDLVSFVGGALETAKERQVFAQAQFDTLRELELSDGVDTDAEMQRLLLIEQAYAANAHVIQVADEMLDWLMRI